MNTMKGFYASIASGSGPQSSYLDALTKITRVNRQQTGALMSEMGWQNWGEQDQKTAIYKA